MAFLDDILGRKAVLHLGCGSCYEGKELELAQRVLDKLGISHEVLDFSCGCEHYDFDHQAFERDKEAAIKLLKGKHIIVGCARCFHILRSYGLHATHISKAIQKQLKDKDLRPVKGSAVYYHDPCFLVRYSKVAEGPREVLRKLGYLVLDLDDNRIKTDCCGGYTPITTLRRRASAAVLDPLPEEAVIASGCTNCTKNMRAYVDSARQAADLNKQTLKFHTVKAFLELVDSAIE